MSVAADHHANEILTQGYTIIPDVLDAEQVKAGRTALEEVFAAEAEIGKIRKWHNATYKAAYLLPQKHPFFRMVAVNPNLLPVISGVLGTNYNLSNVNGMGMTPGGETQSLHLDAFESTPGTCVYINALHCLDDFTQANGGTRIVPGSHNQIWTRQNITTELEKQAIYLNAKAGSVIAYNGALLHAGSRNTTELPRRALHLYYHRAWAKPQWDYPRSFSADLIEQLSDQEKRLYGFYSAPQIYDVKTNEIVRPMWGGKK